MQLNLSLLLTFGILTVGLCLNPKEEECEVRGVDVTVSIVCNNCSSMYICSDSIDPYLVTCAEGTYCSQEQGAAAKCVTQLPDECTKPIPPEPKKSLLCTGAGFYPDPFDCAGFHYCTDYGQPSQFQSCPPNYNFDPDYTSEPCLRQDDETENCLAVDCTEESIFKHYGDSNRFYAYCRTDEATDETVVSMFRCADGTSFDGLRCVFQCQGEGNFANPLSDSSYYQCYFSDELLVNRLLLCPKTRKFNEALQICL